MAGICSAWSSRGAPAGRGPQHLSWRRRRVLSPSSIGFSLGWLCRDIVMGAILIVVCLFLFFFSVRVNFSSECWVAISMACGVLL